MHETECRNVAVQRGKQEHDGRKQGVGFSACGCQKKSVVHETECRNVAVQRGKQEHDGRKQGVGSS